MYINDIEASVPNPLKTLRKFRKVFLKKGESKNITFDISPEDLTVFDNNGKPFVEPGTFEVFVGENSETTNKVILTVQ